MGDAEKTTDRRPNIHKAGARRLGTQMETQQLVPPPVSLLYTVPTRGGEAILQGGGVTL
jgi:hypothetical protein